MTPCVVQAVAFAGSSPPVAEKMVDSNQNIENKPKPSKANDTIIIAKLVDVVEDVTIISAITYLINLPCLKASLNFTNDRVTSIISVYLARHVSEYCFWRFSSYRHP